MPRAAAVLATRRPTFPTPMMPSVLPFISSRPCQRLLPQSARRVRRSTTTACLASASISIMACSATELELEPGAWTTGMPSSVAAGRSMVSRPTPWRPTTLSSLHAAMSERVQSGLARKRMPEASCATLIIPASVSSLDTMTRASLSSCLMPSAWMGPARITRGFMSLLSQGEHHLDDSQRRIGLERIPPPRVHEPTAFVEACGGIVPLRHPQLEALELSRPRPFDGGAQQQLARSPAPAFRLHPHAPDVADPRPLLVEDAEDEPERASLLLREEHDLPARRRHRLGEPDPVRIGLSLLVDEAAREGAGRIGERAQPELPEKSPFPTLERTDPHAGPTPLLGRHEHDAGRVQEEGPAIEPAEELHPGPALGPQHAEQLVSRVQADLDPAQMTPGGLEPPVHRDPARADVEPVLHARGALGQPPRLLRGQVVEDGIAVPRIEHEGAPRLEGGAEPVDEEPILVVGEESDAREEIEGVV